MAPDTRDPDVELGRFQDELKQMAQQQLDRRLWDKVDLSGVVQETLLDAFRAGEQFRGLSEAEKPAWLRTVLAHNLIDALDKLRTGKRDVRRESPLEAALDESSARLAAYLASDESSPSQKAIRNEEASRLKEALGQLSEGRRRAVELHLQGLKLEEIAQAVGKTKAAAAQDLSRGIKDLHAKLGPQ
jgi:RNA polymerase sigma-70 factor (ECF subfamily)